jgi:hypothetical protein
LSAGRGGVCERYANLQGDDVILKRFAIPLIATATALLFIPTQAFASEQSDVMATVRQFVDGFNAGNTKRELAACASQVSIIDEFPPHEWQGPTACADWAAAYAANSKEEGITAGFVALGKPWRVDVTADRAYVVAPATFRYEQRGRHATESNSIFTVALRKVAAGWRITGWAWSQR